jgi:hypothetical protein
VTPGRLNEYLRSRNPDLDSRFESVAVEYMRIGEELGVRWDFAFYQMILETGALSYRRGHRSGDVKPAQNNFAGLGATGRGEPGESFKDIATGVRAHLEHLLLYSGQKLDNPTAERTRKVQEWGVLTKWQSGFSRPINFSDVATKWAPGSNGHYNRVLSEVAARFASFCGRPDPRPELVAQARGRNQVAAAPKTERPAETDTERPAGADLAKRAIADAKVEGNDRRSALGAAPEATAERQFARLPPASYTILNKQQADQPAAAEAPTPAPTAPATAPTAPLAKAAPPSAKPPAPDVKAVPPVAKVTPSEAKAAAAAAGPRTTRSAAGEQPEFHVASAANAAKPLVPAANAAKPPPAAGGHKCRVWTASYGGQKALIIKSVVDQIVNYTVLDVNEGAERREADAFISAYAKGGSVTDVFGNQSQALDKAFELCPEG